MIGGPSKGPFAGAFHAGSSQPRAVGAAVISPALQRGESGSTNAFRSPGGTALMLCVLLTFLREEWKSTNRVRFPEMSIGYCHPARGEGSPSPFSLWARS